MSNGLIKNIVESLGGYRLVAERLGVKHTTLHSHISAGKFPAKWFEAISALCAEADLPAPEKDLFSFSKLRGAQKNGVAA